MSYSCEISFKQIQSNEIYSFFQSIKKSLQDNEIVNGLCKDLMFNHKLARITLSQIDEHFEKYKDFSDLYKARLDDDTNGYNIVEDLKESVKKNLTFRWFYISEENLLGVFGVPKTLQRFFDNMTYFQNSTDQDYDWETWDNIDLFQRCVKRAKDISLKALKIAKDVSDEALIDLDEEYWRKSLAYDLI